MGDRRGIVTNPEFSNFINAAGRTSLHYAAQSSRTDICQFMLNLNAFRLAARQDQDGNTALHEAAYFGHIGPCRVLLGFIAANTRNRSGETTLDMARDRHRDMAWHRNRRRGRHRTRWLEIIALL